MQSPRLLGWTELRQKGITTNKDHLRRLWTRGEFPKPIHISVRRIAWVEAEIDQHIADLVAARDAAA